MKKIKKILESTFLNILASFLAFIVTIFIGRNLSVDDYGDFSTALFIVMLVAPLVGFGVPKFLLKEFGRDGVNASRWLVPAFKFSKLSFSFILIGLISISLIFIKKSNIFYIIIMLLPVLLHQFFIEFYSIKLQLERDFRKMALVNGLPHVLRLSLLLILFYISDNLTLNQVAIAFSLVSIILFLLGFRSLIDFRDGNINYHKDYNLGGSYKEKIIINNKEIKLRDIIVNSWPFGAMGLAYLIFFQINIMSLNLISGSYYSGIYSAAFVFIAASFIFPSILYQKILLPSIHVLAHHDIKNLKKLYIFGNFSMFITGLIGAILIIFFSKQLIIVFFNSEYILSVSILKILALSLPFRFLSNSLGSILVTRDSMVIKVKIMMLVAFISLVLGSILIFKYNVYGAAITTLICEFLLMFLYYLQTRSYFLIGEENG